SNRLSICDDRQSLECCRRQPLWASGKLRSLDRLRVLRPSQNLPAAGHFDQLDPMTLVVIMISQLSERRFQRGLAVVGVGRHQAQRVDWHGNSAREERRLKQLR